MRTAANICLSRICYEKRKVIFASLFYHIIVVYDSTRFSVMIHPMSDVFLLMCLDCHCEIIKRVTIKRKNY